MLICSFHHRLVHECGWRLEGTATELRWFRPDGTRYRAGPAPPAITHDRINDPSVALAV